MRKIIFGIGTIALIVGSIVFLQLRKTAVPAAGFLAREICAERFINGRPLEAIQRQDFIRYDDGLSLFAIAVDDTEQRVDASLFPLTRMSAANVPGHGCVIGNGEPIDLPKLPPIQKQSWPVGDPDAFGFDSGQLNSALDEIFADALPNHRGMLIVRNGNLLAERYAPGFTQDMQMLSFSMAKSVTAIMIGAAIEHGFFTLDDRPPLEEWSAPGDPRQAITWRDLLQMQSGLEFQEVYTDLSADVSQMNILEHSAGAFAANKPLEHEPGTHWKYSTGTSNILQYALRNVLESQNTNYNLFAAESILSPIGADSVVLGLDPSGTIIGGSYVYATARDWAKLGQLILQDGIWNGRRILPEGWLEFMRTPASASREHYGAQVWLNRSSDTAATAAFPNYPEGALYFSGWQGQVVLIIPDWDMVVVHLGRTPADGGGEADPAHKALSDIVDTFYAK